MKFLLFIVTGIFLFQVPAFTQVLPEGYILQYGQSFNNNKGLSDFRFTDPIQWKIMKLQKNYYLNFTPTGNSDSLALSLPSNRTILKDRIFGDFILEADVMTRPGDQGSPEVCLMMGVKDSTRYYLILLSTDPANDLQGIYLVKNNVRTKLTRNSGFVPSLALNSWQKIRIERDIIRRTIRVFSGNMQLPVLEVKDFELVIGSVGFGSLYSPLSLDNLSIWAPTMIGNEP